ncbi:MAG: hypothetical protein HY476_02475 [Nitrosarchaeum sp.]|nr:hypothetical protein [Nitrosarchaeum sp.]
MDDNLKISLQYYGISPWEIEVIYGYLNSRFSIIQEEIEANDENFVSFLNLDIPLAFNEEFFKWFDFRRWEKMKAVFKEMKRRRGTGNALKIIINFLGKPKIVFVLDTEDRQWYDNAIEKIDFVLELLPYHLDPEKLPSDVLEIVYKFDPESIRWRLNTATSENKRYIFRGDSWSAIT